MNQTYSENDCWYQTGQLQRAAEVRKLHGVEVYCLMVARRVAWAQVNKARFLAVWFELSADQRRCLLRKHGLFAEELDVDCWFDHLLDRDDAPMLAAALGVVGSGLLPDIALLSVPWRCVTRGAVQCLLLWAHANGWVDGQWGSYRLFGDAFKGAHKAVAACTAAAGQGNLRMLRMLRKRGGCAWNEHTCAAAAKGGHLPCLQYAHENGCPMRKYRALQHLACARYARKYGTTRKYCKKNQQQVAMDVVDADDESSFM